MTSYGPYNYIKILKSTAESTYQAIQSTSSVKIIVVLLTQQLF
jgi:hypothetical protein